MPLLRNCGGSDCIELLFISINHIEHMKCVHLIAVWIGMTVVSWCLTIMQLNHSEAR